MTYVVAVIEDGTFEEPHVVIGVSEHQVATAVGLYLAATMPATPMGRLEIDLPEAATFEWLHEVLADVDDVSLVTYSTADDSMKPCGAFVLWLAEHREKLYAQHIPAVVDVINSL